jgi:hypothetical protein
MIDTTMIEYSKMRIDILDWGSLLFRWRFFYRRLFWFKFRDRSSVETISRLSGFKVCFFVLVFSPVHIEPLAWLIPGKSINVHVLHHVYVYILEHYNNASCIENIVGICFYKILRLSEIFWYGRPFLGSPNILFFPLPGAPRSGWIGWSRTGCKDVNPQ